MAWPDVEDNVLMKMCIVAAGVAVMAFGFLAGPAPAGSSGLRNTEGTGPGVQGVTEQAVWVRNEPKHHLLFENENVRVYDVIVPPGEATLFHVHAVDYVYITLGDAALKSEVQGQQPTDLPARRGEVRFTAGPITHRVQNVGTTPFHNITVELLRPPSATPATLPAPPWNGPENIVLENDRVRITRLVLDAGRTTATYTLPARMLVVPVTSGNLRVEAVGAAPRTFDLKVGTADWQPESVTAAISNPGTSGLEIVHVELK